MMGKPTSDEEKKMKVRAIRVNHVPLIMAFQALEAFKAQHPEMDFSNAKWS